LVRGRAKNGGADVLDERRKRAPGQTRINREKEKEKFSFKKTNDETVLSLLLDDVGPVPARFGASKDKRVHRVI
jgi:hypothetical protein